MELFKLVGEILIKGVDKAKTDVKSVGDSAKTTAKDVGASTTDISSSTQKQGSSWSQLKGKVAEYKQSGMTTSQAWKQAASDMRSSTENASNGMTSAFKKIGAAVVTFLAVDKIISFGSACLQAAADAQAMESQFSQVFGDLEAKASKSLSAIADSTGISENRIKGSYTKIAAFAKTTGMETADAMNLSDRAMMAVADSAAFYDRSIEETTESLQSFLKGNYENDAALGLSATETTRNAAANKLYGKSFNELSESQKQLTLLQMVEDANKTSGALGQAARESETWTNVIGNMKQGWKDFQAVIGAAVLPKAVKVVKNMADGLSELADKTKEAIEWCKEHESIVKAIGIMLGTAALAIGAYNLSLHAASIATGILTGLTSAFGAVMAFITSPITLVVLAIGALVAAVVYCYNKFEGFRNIVDAVGKFIKEKLVAAFEFLKPYFQDIVEAIGELVSAIKDRLLQAFQWITDKITEVKESSSPVIEALKTIFKTSFENIKVVVETVFGFIKTYISTALEVIKNVIKTITAIIKGDWKGAWEGIKAIFSSIWNGIKTMASTAINGVKTVLSNGIKAAKTVVSDVLDSIKSKFSSIFKSVQTTVKNAIDKVKGYFKFKWSLPKIKVPRFNVSGGKAPWGFMGKGSLPKVSVSWYKKAYDNPMLLNDPTIFGYSAATGKYLGGGDGNGSELVGGTNTIMNMIREAVASQNEALIQYVQTIIHEIAEFYPQMLEALQNMKLVADDGTILAYYVPKIDRELGKTKDRKDRGR